MVPCLRFLGSIQLKKRGKRSSVSRACIGSMSDPIACYMLETIHPFPSLELGGLREWD